MISLLRRRLEGHLGTVALTRVPVHIVGELGMASGGYQHRIKTLKSIIDGDQVSYRTKGLSCF